MRRLEWTNLAGHRLDFPVTKSMAAAATGERSAGQRAVRRAGVNQMEPGVELKGADLH
jgi:hypothetical protein